MLVNCSCYNMWISGWARIWKKCFCKKKRMKLKLLTEMLFFEKDLVGKRFPSTSFLDRHWSDLFCFYLRRSHWSTLEDDCFRGKWAPSHAHPRVNPDIWKPVAVQCCKLPRPTRVQRWQSWDNHCPQYLTTPHPLTNATLKCIWAANGWYLTNYTTRGCIADLLMSQPWSILGGGLQSLKSRIHSQM